MATVAATVAAMAAVAMAAMAMAVAMAVAAMPMAAAVAMAVAAMPMAAAVAMPRWPRRCGGDDCGGEGDGGGGGDGGAAESLPETRPESPMKDKPTARRPPAGLGIDVPTPRASMHDSMINSSHRERPRGQPRRRALFLP